MPRSQDSGDFDDDDLTGSGEIDYAAIALQGGDETGQIVVCPRHGLTIDLRFSTDGLPTCLECDMCLRDLVGSLFRA